MDRAIETVADLILPGVICAPAKEIVDLTYLVIVAAHTGRWFFVKA